MCAGVAGALGRWGRVTARRPPCLPPPHAHRFPVSLLPTPQGKPLTTRVHSRCDVGRSGRIDNVRYNVVWMKA